MRIKVRCVDSPVGSGALEEIKARPASHADPPDVDGARAVTPLAADLGPAAGRAERCLGERPT